MNSDQIMELALAMAGMDEIPGDSAIYYPGEASRRILFAVDIGAGELAVAAQLGFDAVIAHHPPRGAALPLWQVYNRHVDLMKKEGVPDEAAQAAVEATLATMQGNYHSGNHEHFPSLSRLLNMPFMNIHGPLDELGRRTMQAAIDDANVQTVEEVMEALASLPEMVRAKSEVTLAAGSPTNAAGKVVVAHGCLTNGGYAVADTYFRHGVATVVYIHCAHADAQRLAQEGRGNLIIAGHIASDLVGINPFLQALTDAGLEVVALDGAKAAV